MAVLKFSHYNKLHVLSSNRLFILHIHASEENEIGFAQALFQLQNTWT